MSVLAVEVQVDASWRVIGLMLFALIMLVGGWAGLAWLIGRVTARRAPCPESCCQPERRVSDRYRGRRRTSRQPTGAFLADTVMADGYEPPSASLNPAAHVPAPVRRTSDHPDATVILQRIKDPS